MTTRPAWLDDVLACDQRAEFLREQQAQLADHRARLIADAVAAYGRGGRQAAAEQLGVRVLQIDQALKRARTAGAPPSGLPHDLLERLYALELADLPPLPARLWRALAEVLASTLIDVTWLEQPGLLLADEVQDAAADGELDEDVAQQLAKAASSWSRLQALAVIDAIQRRDLEALPVPEGGPVCTC